MGLSTGPTLLWRSLVSLARAPSLFSLARPWRAGAAPSLLSLARAGVAPSSLLLTVRRPPAAREWAWAARPGQWIVSLDEHSPHDGVTKEPQGVC